LKLELDDQERRAVGKSLAERRARLIENVGDSTQTRAEKRSGSLKHRNSFLFPLLLRESHIFRDLVGPLLDRQFRAMKVLRDLPHASVAGVHLDDIGRNAVFAKNLNASRRCRPATSRKRPALAVTDIGYCNPMSLIDFASRETASAS
jgi:hypothetical protein